MTLLAYNTNFIILAMVSGALLLASVYHTILFFHNKLNLVGFYALYLWSAFSFCFFRCVFYDHTPEYVWFIPDEVLQMISFALYIRFTKVAMELDKKNNPLAYWFCVAAPFVIAVHIVLYNFFIYIRVTRHTDLFAEDMTYYIVRAFLLLIGFTGLMAIYRKRSNLYFRYIIFGIISLIFTGLLATLMTIYWDSFAGINSLSVLTVGYNIEVFFFSAAISYKMRMETLEKEKANQRVLEQELEIQRNNMERMALSFKVKEEERSRIATELHDEIGSTMSSISILSDVITKERNETSKMAMQQEIRSNSKLMMEKMDDIIWSLNPRNDSMERMLLRIRQFASPLFEARNINYHFRFSEGVYDVPLTIEKRQQAYLIIKEAINNLVKHSGCTEATFAVTCEEDVLSFSITDNGKGFDTATEFSGNGMFNMKQRADNVGAEIRMQSVANVETSVTLLLKIG